MNQDAVKKNMEHASAREIADELAKILYQKGAMEIKLYEVTEDTSLTDFHLIVTGRSGTHVKALADDADYEMGERGVNVRSIEGRDAGNWILLDFLSVIVHVFDPASREFYNLERLQKKEHEIDISFLFPEIQDTKQ